MIWVVLVKSDCQIFKYKLKKSIDNDNISIKLHSNVVQVCFWKVYEHQNLAVFQSEVIDPLMDEKGLEMTLFSWIIIMDFSEINLFVYVSLAWT